MKPSDIILALRAKDAKILGDVTDKKAEQIVKAAFAVIRENVEALDQGDVTIAALGRFHVRQVPAAKAEGEGQGEEATTRKRVLYFAAKPALKAVPPILEAAAKVKTAA